MQSEKLLRNGEKSSGIWLTLFASTEIWLNQPLTLRGSDYGRAVHELNKPIDRAERFLQMMPVCAVATEEQPQR
jgi:hypothetical protein